MSPLRVLSKDGIGKGLGLYPKGNIIKLLGSIAADPGEDFSCCCGFSGCGVCENTDPDGVESFTVTGALFGNSCISGHVVIPFQLKACSSYFGAIVKTGRYPIAENEFSAAVRSTFDGMAIKSGYVVCLYFRKNFNRTDLDQDIGEPDMIFKGPKVINNTRRYELIQGTPKSAPFPLYHSTQYTGNWHSIFSNPSIIVCRLPSSSTQVEQYGFESADYDGTRYRTQVVYTRENPLIE